MKAKDIEIGDQLRTWTSTALIRSFCHDTIDTGAIKIELEKPSGKFFVGGPSSEKSVFVEVYGDVSSVRPMILRFKRFDRFGELLNSSELEPCRRELSGKGINSDLTEHGLGPGKMFVDANIAWLVLQHLNERNMKMKCSEIVVDSYFEDIVMDLVQRLSGRPRIVEPEVEILMLPKHHTKNTFLEAGSSTGESSGVTKSL